MLSFDNTIEFTDIVLKSPLPLDQYLIENSRLSLRLVINGIPCSETPVVDGDRETGRWVLNTRLHVPQESDSFKLAAIVNVGGLKVQLLAINHSVAKVIACLKGRPESCHKISICEPKCPIQLNVVCKMRASSSLTGSPFIPISKQRRMIDASEERESGAGSNVEGKDSKIPSREDLESYYLKATRLPACDTKATALSQLGRVYHALYKEANQKADLEKAVCIHEEAIRFTSVFHPKLADHFEHAGDALKAQFKQNRDPAVIEKAISYYETVLRANDDGDPTKASHLSDLAIGLSLRFERLGQLADIERAVKSLQKAVEITPYGHPNRSLRLSNLGASLLHRFERLGNLSDVDSAISVHQEAVKITPDGHPDRSSRMNNLGTSLLRRFERLGSLSDVDSAISVLHEAVNLTPDGHPDTPLLLSNLGNSLSCRFERLGSLSDLDSGISVLQEAIKITPDSHPDKPSLLSNLGTSLMRRFERLGSLSDVDSAISVQQEAVKITPDGHPDKPSQLSNLGSSLSRRFERLGNLSDVDSAISAHQEAVKITPDGHPDKPSLLSNLGTSLLRRFQRLGSLSDVDSAISVLQEAVKITSDGHPEKPSRLNNLGTSLKCRFERLGSLSDVDSAISVQQEAVKITPDGHPSKPSQLSNLGISLLRRFERLGDCNDLENALRAFSRAAYSLVGPPMHRFNAACSWAIATNQNSRSPLPAFRCAIDLLPRIAWLGLKETDQHALLADIGHVVREAVAAAVKYEEYETAVEWAEQGQSIVWQNLLNLRSPIDDLCAFDPILANRLKDIGRQLESPAFQVIEAGKLPATPVEDVARRYSKLATEWDTIVEEIRRIPNFEGFLGAKRFAQLAPAASEGPVVILNVHHSRSDALVLIQDESSEFGVSVVNIPLEPFVYGISKILLESMAGLLSTVGVRSRGIHEYGSVERDMSGDCSSYEVLERLFEDLRGHLSSPGLRQSKRRQPHTETKLNFREILGLLWIGVVKPVLDGLAISAELDHPLRIWWCATGPLSFLPLHAAGIYGTGENGDIISDYVVSSYTPTLNAILDPSQPSVQADFQILTVAVAQPSLPGALPIYGTEDEVQLVQSLVKANGIQCVNLIKENATVKRVVQEMMESNWIHLACHGQQNIKNSMESGFLLHDRILQLSEIVKLSLPKADFAFLSACQTATGDEKIAEESVHLAAGMLLSGCRGVIATMWSISDKDAPKVAKDVYDGMLKGGRPNRKGAAYALHEAVKGLRDSGADFLSWVPFIHIGR